MEAYFKFWQEMVVPAGFASASIL